MTDAEPLESQEALPKFFQSKVSRPALIAGLIIYFLFLVLSRMPASIAAWALHQALPTFWMTSVQGTLWDGRAGGAQVDIGSQTIPLGYVRWQLSPWSLLFLKPCLVFETEVPGQQVSGTVCQSPFGSTTVEGLNVEVPVAVINELLPAPASGQLSLQVISASFSGQVVEQMDARFSWQNGSVYAIDSWLPLGSFGGQVQQNGEGGIQAKLFDISGAIGLDMEASWFPGAENWAADGTVTPKKGAPVQVAEGLKIFGEETTPGTYRVVLPL